MCTSLKVLMQLCYILVWQFIGYSVLFAQINQDTYLSCLNNVIFITTVNRDASSEELVKVLLSSDKMNLKIQNEIYLMLCFAQS